MLFRYLRSTSSAGEDADFSTGTCSLSLSVLAQYHERTSKSVFETCFTGVPFKSKLAELPLSGIKDPLFQKDL